MRVYFNLVVLALGLGALALAFAAQTVSACAPAGLIPFVVVGAAALLALAAALFSARSTEGDLGRAFCLILLTGGVSFAVGRMNLLSGASLAWGLAAALTLPHFLLALAISLRSHVASNEILRDLIASEGPLENTLIALSTLGPEGPALLGAELESSRGDTKRHARCVDLLAAFPRNQTALRLAEDALESPEAPVRAAALRALTRIDPRRAAEVAGRAQDDPDPEVRAAAAAASS